MAVSTENSNKVWQKAKSALNVAGASRSGGAVAEALAQLKLYLATQKANPDLQFLSFAAADIDTGADGAVAVAGAGRLYAIYAKRVADSDATDSFLEVLDDATDNSAPTTDILACIRFSETLNQEGVLLIFPGGLPFADGLVVSSTTTAGGTTESAATESANGFLIVGAA